MTDRDRAFAGEQLEVDVPAIERSLAELWKNESESEGTVTRAALWNVVAHASTEEQRKLAASTLSAASVSVPQRSIIVEASLDAVEKLTAWISANCTMVGGGKQVCSEEITIVASGSRVATVPSLVRALLIPEMPVAAWWIGDLPLGRDEYVTDLLDVADRLIVDSHAFDSPEDLALVERIGKTTSTAPADLTWVRLEDLRIATASLFDAEAMRPHVHRMRKVSIRAHGDDLFGAFVEPLYFAGWLVAQLGQTIRAGAVHGTAGPVEYRIEHLSGGTNDRSVESILIEFDDGTSALVERIANASAVQSSILGTETVPATVTTVVPRDLAQLLTRLLSHTYDDRVFARVLPLTRELAGFLLK